MRKFAMRVAAGLIATAMPIAAQATVIDFSGYAEGTTYDMDLVIGGAVFSAGGGLLKIVNFGAGNTLCASNGYTCTRGLSVAFAQGAANLSFAFSGDTTEDSAVRWQGETPFLSFVGGSRGDGDPATVQRQSFSNSRYDDLTHITITPGNGNAIGFNSFSFTSNAAVPEPATWAMMLVGFGAIGFGLRRRQPVRALGVI